MRVTRLGEREVKLGYIHRSRMARSNKRFLKCIARYIAKCQQLVHINIAAMYSLRLLNISVTFIVSAADQS